MESQVDLVKKARQKDTEAFAKLYGMICDDLYRFAVFMLGNKQDAEDVVSETVLAAFSQIAKLRKAEAFRSWMFQILVNQCKKKRKSYVNQPTEIQDDYFEPQVDREEICDLHRALNELKEEERMIVLLSTVGGYNSKEIGAYLKMNANTVRMQRAKALARLRDRMDYRTGKERLL